MDPIMKLLEDDEDESMHSGADVEAFTAALNREVEAIASSSSASASAASSSQPTDHGSGILSQENNTSSSPDHAQWQDSVKSEIENQERLQKEDSLHLGKDCSCTPEVISQGSNNKDLHSKTPTECDSPKVKKEPGTSAPQSIVVQQQSLNQMRSQQPTGSIQTNSATTMGDVSANVDPEKKKQK